MQITAISPLALIGAVALQPAIAAAMPPAEAWEIGPSIKGRNYSVGMPVQPSMGRAGTVTFDFPLARRGEVDAMTTPLGSLEGARQVTMQYRIDAAPGTRFVASETPGETATVSLYFQRQADNWTGKGRYASYRWYAPARAVMPLSPGEHKVTIRFDETWTNVHGASNRQDPAGFAAAVHDPARLGIAFGSASRRSHGVHATAPARFTLLELDIR